MRTVTAAAAIAISCGLARGDILHYGDGRAVRCVVLGESERSVTVSIHGQRVEVPRSMLSSVERETAEENAALEARWEGLRSRYATEARRAREREPLAAPTTEGPPAPPRATPSPAPLLRPLLRPAPVTTAPAPTPLDAVRERITWRQEVKTAIARRQVIPGMTQREVRAAWGWPEQTHPVGGVDGTTDRWTYRRPGEGRVDLYFRNDILTHEVR
ncbi:MAG: hypothetical protein PHN82_09840 [bacterium]|nr:hypothetical protein [bacterium]